MAQPSGSNTPGHIRDVVQTTHLPALRLTQKGVGPVLELLKGTTKYLILANSGILTTMPEISGAFTISGALTVSGAIALSGAQTVSGKATHSADIVLQDSKKLLLGTGEDAQVYYDGTDLIIKPAAVGTGEVKIQGGALAVDATERIYLDGGGNTYMEESAADTWHLVVGGVSQAKWTDGVLALQKATNIQSTLGITIGLATSAPAPDGGTVHIWKATAGAVTALADSLLTLENSGDAYLQLLGGATSTVGVLFGDTVNNAAGITYNHSTNIFTFRIDSGNVLSLSGTSFVFGARNWSVTQSSAGVTRSHIHDITVGAGGAANVQLSHQLQLDSVFEAGLSGETDGSGGVTAATQVWKVPYRDSGGNVAAPAALNVEVLGGLRVEAGDDTNRIYFRANEAWHYITQTAGFEIPEFERACPQCGSEIQVGERVVGRINSILDDGARHGLWEHERCP